MLIKIMQQVVNSQQEISNNELGILYEKLSTEGQHPETLLLTCVDSRVTPALLARQPGEILIHRNAGNIMVKHKPEKKGSSEAASLGFAVSHLKVKDIIVMGHSDCGAMKTLLNPNSNLPDMTTWVQQHADDALKEWQAKNPESTDLSLLTKQNILTQIEHIRSYPSVRERIEKNALTIHGWYFDLKEKKVFIYQPECCDFIEVEEALKYAIHARRDKVVQTLAYQYLSQLFSSNDGKIEHKIHALLDSLEENLTPIWPHIKDKVATALWQEVAGLYSGPQDPEFIAIVNQGKQLKFNQRIAIQKKLETAKSDLNTISSKTQEGKTGIISAFFMQIMAQSSIKAASIIIFVAGLLALSAAACASFATLPAVMATATMSVLGLFSASIMYQRAQSSRTLSAESPPIASSFLQSMRFFPSSQKQANVLLNAATPCPI